MRTDQFAGLPPAALMFLKRHEVEPPVCPCCKHTGPRELTKIGTFSGMFDEEYLLWRHLLTGGHTADEFLQAAPWASGPVHFLGLRVSDGTVFEWPDEEIECP